MADVIYGQQTDNKFESPAVDLTPTPATTELPRVDLTPDLKPVNSIIADAEASHITYGVGNLLPDLKYDDYFKAISTGKEDQMRDHVSAGLNDQINVKTLQVLQQLATSKPGAITPEDYDNVRNALTPTKPVSVFEETFGHRYIDELYNLHKIPRAEVPQRYDWMQRVVEDYPEFSSQLKQKSSDLVAWLQGIDRRLSRTQEAIEEESGVRHVWNVTKTMLPGYQQVQFGTLFPGSTLENKRREYFNLPLAERLTKLDKDLAELTPEMGMQYLSAMKGLSSEEQFINDVLPAFDFTVAYGAVKGTVGFTRAVMELGRMKTGAKEMIKAQENLKLKPVDVAVADATGEIDKSAVLKVSKDEIAALGGKGKTESERAMEELYPIVNPRDEKIKADPGSFGGDNANKIVEQKNADRQTFFQKVTDAMKIRRIPAVLAIEAVVRNIMEDSKKLYVGATNQIVGTTQHLIYRQATNSHGFYFFFGDEGGVAFDNPVRAKTWANNKGWEGAQIIDNRESLGIKYTENSAVVPKGAGYLVAEWVPLRENESIVRHALLRTKEVQSPYSWHNSVLTWLRTPEETLSAAESANRGVAEFVPQALMREVKDSIKTIRKFARSSLATRSKFKEWSRAVDYAQHAIDPETKKPGYWFTPGELDNWYQTHVGRLPEEVEHRAYQEIQDAYEKDWVLRNLRLKSDMDRVGVKSHQIWYVGAKGKEPTMSPWFSGIKMDKLPLGKDGILVFDGKGGYKEYNGANPNWMKARKDLTEQVENGSMKLVRIYNPDINDMKQFSNNRIRYVVAPESNFSQKELPLFNIPQRGGGHHIYDYEYWISQANMSQQTLGKDIHHIYLGDTNFAGVQIGRLARDYVKHLNAVRELIRDGKLEEAKVYNNTHLDIAWEKHYGWYQEQPDPKGFKLRPHFNINEPFHVRNRGQLLISKSEVKEDLLRRYGQGAKEYDPSLTPEEQQSSRFVDGTRHGSDARQNSIEFSGERDAHDLLTINNEGSKGNPIYKTAPAAIVDPITALNRGLSRIVNSFVMDDYKYFAVEHWMAQAKLLMKPDESTINYSPFKYFENPEWSPGLKGEDLQLQKQLEANRWKIKQFLGIPDRVSNEVHSISQKLVDSIYGKFGPKLTPTWLLPGLGSGSVYGDVRSLVFHLKLGLFNVPQFFKQASTFVNVLGMAGPKYAGPGAAATLFHQWARISPGMVDTLDNYLSKLRVPGMARWKPGEFKESMEIAKQSGFLDGVHSHISLDIGQTAMESRWGTFLKWGSTPFSEGANNTKIAAWHTAFKEFRDKNPTGPLSMQDKHEIFRRARTLNHNMDRASASVFQTGLPSFTFQFKSYTLRLAELMTGKRLTPVEKTRLFMTAGSLYGFPLAFGLYGLPFDDLFRPNAIQGVNVPFVGHVGGGYHEGDNAMTSFFMQGGMGLLHAFITGKGDIQKGDWLDYGQQFGPVGFTELTQNARTDSPIIDILFGAAGSVMADSIKSMDPFFMWAHNAAFGKGNEDLRPDDVLTAMKSLINPVKESSAYARAERLYVALKTGQWLSKNGTYLTDVDKYNAIYMSTLGLQPSEVTNIGALEDLIKGRENTEKQATSRYKHLLKQSLLALRNNDIENSNSLRMLARSNLVYIPRDKWSQLFSSAVRDNKALVESVPYDAYVKGTGNLSKEEQEMMQEIWQRIYANKFGGTE